MSKGAVAAIGAGAISQARVKAMRRSQAGEVARKKASLVGAASPSGLLERTLRVLELLSDNAHGLLLFEIADQLRIPRSATHRVLTSLLEHGYVRQERHQGAYQLTAKIASLAFTFLTGSGITDFAQPILDKLARECGELVRLAMIDGKALVWVAKAQGSPHGLRYDPDMGQIGRLSCSASGHAWLACLPDEEALALVEKQGFGLRSEYGPRAPETKGTLLKYLRETRRRGFSVCVQTYSPWMNSFAAAIRHPNTKEVTGAVVIAGPNIRLTEARMLELSPLLVAAAQELSLATVASPGLYGPKARTQVSIFDEPRDLRV
ncbi:IclR family transcriptional regulator [Bradyrhizobium sp. LHD-71]|uniref:IclR family transcriptional regulator n=1 Tax=Bradyrhizobium sp. LHD-71 TaxID=3072141 RepID=UPI0028103A6A|nr:IclR family transcriptional regulator [Bradyrhizobium sp. LHD-71]MDQ8729836.1 IclR family transcriptional regulator [Bradyrhizobium sp. LHD-71]